jgi:hypothetical protein
MPFAQYADFDDCVAKNSDRDDPAAYCASIQRKVEKTVSIERVARVLNHIRKHYGPGDHASGSPQSVHGGDGAGEKWDADNPGPAARPPARSGRPQLGRSHLERPAHTPRRDTEADRAWDAAEDEAVTALEDRRDMERREHERSPYQTWSRNPDKGDRLPGDRPFSATDDHGRGDRRPDSKSMYTPAEQARIREAGSRSLAPRDEFRNWSANQFSEGMQVRHKQAPDLRLKVVRSDIDSQGEPVLVVRDPDGATFKVQGREVEPVGKRDGSVWSIPVKLAKSDADRQLVFGWASVAKTPDGLHVVDVQGDLIPVEELETAAYAFAADGGTSGAMHKGGGFGTLVESVVFTDEKLAKMGIPPGTVPTGWWVGFHLPADEFAKVKQGIYKMFSIQGRAIRIPEEDDS